MYPQKNTTRKNVPKADDMNQNRQWIECNFVLRPDRQRGASMSLRLQGADAGGNATVSLQNVSPDWLSTQESNLPQGHQAGPLTWEDRAQRAQHHA